MNFQPESIPAKGSPSLLSSKRTSVTWLSQPDLKPFRRSHMPISERILRERQARYDRRIAEAKVNVPEGDYCYGNTGRMIATTLPGGAKATVPERSEEHTSELQSLMRISYAVFCLKKKKTTKKPQIQNL